MPVLKFENLLLQMNHSDPKSRFPDFNYGEGSLPSRKLISDPTIILHDPEILSEHFLTETEYLIGFDSAARLLLMLNSFNALIYLPSLEVLIALTKLCIQKISLVTTLGFEVILYPVVTALIGRSPGLGSCLCLGLSLCDYNLTHGPPFFKPQSCMK